MAKSRENAPAGILPLADAIRKATKSAQFVVEGSLPVADPGLIVNGLGHVPLPLKRGASKSLITACQVAPYGMGTKTLIDERVRKTFELDPSKFELRDEWNEAIANAMASVATSLGLPTEMLEAKLYKLLVYEKGGFFLPHRDSEKHDRMVASLIVALPNPFEGGGLVVRHGPAVRRFSFPEAASGKGACYAAFYADCTHEVERVTYGTRLALAYNLVLAPNRTSRLATKSTPSQALTESIETWMSRNPAKPLVFALDHHYTKRGLALDLLKGADRTLANDVAAAANLAGAHVHLAQVTRHLMNSAFDDNDSYHTYGFREDDDEDDEGGDGTTPDDIQIHDVIEDELYGDEWVDLTGRKKPWGAVTFDTSAIISSIPLDKWKPTSQEYEGYTGNAGNTLDRWYHRSALVVWHRDHHYLIVTRGQATACIPEFLAKAKALSKASEANRTDVRRDVRHYAEALIANWPYRWSHSHPDPATSRLGEAFGNTLLGLHDRDLIAAYLTVLSERDEVTSLTTFVVAACREFGEKSFEKEFTRLITPGPDKYGHQRDLATRNVEWLAALCGDSSRDPERRILAGRLCQQAEGRFYELASRKPSWSESHTASHAETILPALLKALAACGREAEFGTLVQYVCESKHFTMEFCARSRTQILDSMVARANRPGPKFITFVVSSGADSARTSHGRTTNPADRLGPTRGRRVSVPILHEVERLPRRPRVRRHPYSGERRKTSLFDTPDRKLQM